MLAFLSALTNCFQALYLAQEEFTPQACRAAHEALTQVSLQYTELSQQEKKAAKPLADHLAKAVRRLPNGQTVLFTDSQAQPDSVAEPQSNQEASALDGFFRQAFIKDDLGSLEVLSGQNATTKVFTGEPTPENLLHHVQYRSFRTGQREAVEAALDKRDSLVIMPTGGGKSLCYQLPALASDKLTVIVSPLVALIQDQYRLWRDAGHPVVMLASGMSESETAQAITGIRSGWARAVFCSPERLSMHSFLETLLTRQVDLFVVDEAHCVSEWGHDFRPEYLRLQTTIARLGHPPVMATTAAATPEVAREISDKLGLRNPLLISGGFNRPNLPFDVIPFAGKGAVQSKLNLLVKGLQMTENLPAVVYCGTRRDVDKVQIRLSQEGLNSVSYHAGLSAESRSDAQRSFMDGTTEIIVATNAFGMGVNKANVRSFWHWALPTSVEAYYQEAGRAGRDGQPARVVLLAMRADLGRLISFNRKRHIEVSSISEYLTRLQQVAYQGVAHVTVAEDTDEIALAIAERCGAVTIIPSIAGGIDVTLIAPLDYQKAQKANQAVQDRGWQAYTSIKQFAAQAICRRQQILTYFGDSSPTVSLHRCCDVCSPPTWLIDDDDLSENIRAFTLTDHEDNPTIENLPKKRKPTISTERKVNHQPKSAFSQSSTQQISADPTITLYDALVAWRKSVAGKSNQPAFTITQNKTLAAIADALPTDHEQLLTLKGVGPTFLRKYGETILALVEEHKLNG